MPQNFFLFLRCSAGYVNHDLLQVLDRSIDESLSSYLFIWTSFISEPKTKDFFYDEFDYEFIFQKSAFLVIFYCFVVF